MTDQRDTTPEQSHDREERRQDLRWAAAGGIVAGVVGFGSMAVVGTASSYEARRLLESVLPTVRFAASAYVAGGATILALMLTLITFSISHDLEFRRSHYARIRQIAALTTLSIVGSVVLLMFLSFPIGEADVNRAWYLWAYYAVLLGGSVTGGIFIAVILMLFYAIRGLVGVGQDPSGSSLVVAPVDEDSDEQRNADDRDTDERNAEDRDADDRDEERAW